MKTRVAITVDVEPSIAGTFKNAARYRPLIHEPVWGDISGRSEALGFLIDTLMKYELNATFFVETAHVTYFPDHVMGNYVQRLVDAGQEIALHLHPCWLNLSKERSADESWISDQCSDLSQEVLAELMLVGRNRIGSWTGKVPNCFRTGNFSASLEIYRILSDMDLRISSNICTAVNPPSNESLQLLGGIHQIHGVLELPVTCFADRGPIGRGKLRPLQVTACSIQETQEMLMALRSAGGTVAVIVTHPFEFLKWSGPDFTKMRPNRLVQKRFDHLCSFLATNNDLFDVMPLNEIGIRNSELEKGVALKGGILSSTRRAAQNFFNDHFY